MKHAVLLVLLFASSAWGADWAPPSDRAMPGGYTVGASGNTGIPGGIPARTGVLNAHNAPYNADNTGTADAYAAITSALNDAYLSGGTYDVVYLPSGTYRLNNPVNLIPGISLRGDGPATTILKPYGNTGITAGYDPQFNDGFAARGTFTASKGDTNITVTTTANTFNNSYMLQFTAANPDPLLIIEANSVGTIYWSGIVTAKSGSVLTVLPAIPFDVVACEVHQTQLGPRSLMGLEDLTIDGTDGGVMSKGVAFIGSVDRSWIKNVNVTGHLNYGIYIAQSTRIEVTHCYVGQSGPGTSRSGLLMNTVSRAYVYDNRIIGNGPNTELNQGTMGCIVAYNYFDKYGAGGSMNINHGPYNVYNLYEGNLTPQVQSDGYFGGSRWALFFRNWITGVNDGSESAQVVMNRWSREPMVIGNVLQSPSPFTYSDAKFSMGNPLLGTGVSIGVASVYGSLGTLTSRSSASVGTITGPSGHTVTTGATINLWWSADFTSYQQSYFRKGVTVGTVSGTSIPISGGTGDDLPASSTPIYVPTANDAIRDYPLDWDSTTHAPRVWTGTLTVRTDNRNGTAVLDTGMAATMATHLAGSAGGNNVYVTGTGPAAVTLMGSTLTIFTDSSSYVLPATGAISFTPSFAGFQELDLDCIATLSRLKNYNYFDAAIPAGEAFTGGATLGDSQYLASWPAWFGTITWPPFDPANPPATYDNDTKSMIPAGWREIKGNEDYLGQVAQPVFSPAGGTYGSAQTVTITDSSVGAVTIRYTTDGSTPTTSNGTVIASGGTVSVSATMTLKAFAYGAILADSTVRTDLYTITALPSYSVGRIRFLRR